MELKLSSERKDRIRNTDGGASTQEDGKSSKKDLQSTGVRTGSASLGLKAWD